METLILGIFAVGEKASFLNSLEVKLGVSVMLQQGFIPIVCRAWRLENVDFIGRGKGFACQVTEDNHQQIGEFWMFMQLSQHFGFALFRHFKHPHPRTEAAGRRAWVRLCRK